MPQKDRDFAEVFAEAEKALADAKRDGIIKAQPTVSLMRFSNPEDFEGFRPFTGDTGLFEEYVEEV